MTGTIRILVVDDHPLLREAVTLLLTTAEGMTVVGEAADGRTAVDLVARLQPDVVLMDVNMPQMSGLEATQLLCQHGRGVSILMLSADTSPGVVARAKEAGAAGFLRKGRSGADLVQAIRSLSLGHTSWPA